MHVIKAIGAGAQIAAAEWCLANTNGFASAAKVRKRIPRHSKCGKGYSLYGYCP
jgi:hypothetical protein